MLPEYANSAENFVAFGALLERAFDLPLTHWIEEAPWSDLTRQRVTAALDALIAAPISDMVAPSPEEVAASETGSRLRWVLSDAKIAGRDWEGSWQWELLAAIDNAEKAQAQGMVTPADPRLLVLRTRYESDFGRLFMAYLGEHLCGRALLRWFAPEPAAARGAQDSGPDAIAAQTAALRQIPGLESASGTFLAGLLFMIDRLGAKAFCDWCEDFC